MPKRTDIKSILIIGAGPIIIGQACEFDYSGTQACKALKAEGYRIVLVNSNPATIMTDPDLADATYIEPITPEVVARIIEKERPDALLPTMGGQTALNTALSLNRMGVLEKFGVEMIGATADAIDKAEDRERFREAMTRIGLETPQSILAHSLAEALPALDEIGLPLIIRPSFTLGGTEVEGVRTSLADRSATAHRSHRDLDDVGRPARAGRDEDVAAGERVAGCGREVHRDPGTGMRDRDVAAMRLETPDARGAPAGERRHLVVRCERAAIEGSGHDEGFACKGRCQALRERHRIPAHIGRDQFFDHLVIFRLLEECVHMFCNRGTHIGHTH